MIHILYNPRAGKCGFPEDGPRMQVWMQDDVGCRNITKIRNYGAFLNGIPAEDTLVIAGGDGTLNRFANDTAGLAVPQKLLYYPCGNGNDFARDLGYAQGAMPFPVGEYLKHLPTVTVQGIRRRFLNGVGYGIDGWCCEKGDELHRSGKKAVNYTKLSVKGMLGGFRPVGAKITVDGREKTYDHVWIAPTMLGRYYGGGMLPAPKQDRLSGDRTLSLLVLHSKSRCRALCAFPDIFRGRMADHPEIAELWVGRSVRVEFDSPCALQIDGETITDVREYEACFPG